MTKHQENLDRLTEIYDLVKRNKYLENERNMEIAHVKIKDEITGLQNKIIVAQQEKIDIMQAFIDKIKKGVLNGI